MTLCDKCGNPKSFSFGGGIVCQCDLKSEWSSEKEPGNAFPQEDLDNPFTKSDKSDDNSES